MSFVPENPLEDALVRAASDPLAAPAFYRALMEARVLTLGEVQGMPAGGGTRTLRPGETFTLANVRHNGRDYHPIFSSLTRLRRFIREETSYFSVEARMLFTAAKGANFVLNPKAEYGKELMASEVAFWLDPEARRRMPALDRETQVLLGQPAVYPRKLVEALSILFVNRSDVVAAHLAQIAFGDRNEPPHPLIAIETRGHWNRISGEVSEIAAAIAPDTIVDVLALPAGRTDGLYGAIRNIAPFYIRTATFN